jgi:hypothetical protein
MGNICRYFSQPRSTTRANTHNTATKYDNKALSNPKKDLKTNEMVGNALLSSQRETLALGSEEGTSDMNTTDDITSQNDSFPRVTLLPHQHTLFCERKQRVCQAVGKCQELEVLKLMGNLSNLSSWIWFRTTSNKLPSEDVDLSAISTISNSDNKIDHILGLDDVGYHVGVLYKAGSTKSKSFQSDRSIEVKKADGLIGPVLPGPPRFLEFEVAGDLFVGGYAKAEGRYMGGYEGPSEYWWMKVGSDGKTPAGC